MRVLVDVSHPAHVHLFRPAIAEFRDEDHAVHVVSREKDVTTDLLDAYDLPHTVLSRKRRGAAGLPREWLAREVRLYRYAREFDPDVVLSRLNPAAAHVSAALGVPNVVFHDTEQAGLVDRITTPFATIVCTPAGFDRDLGAAHHRYAGFHELAYLHPARFARDPTALQDVGVDPAATYAVVRLVGNDAHHDVGTAGLDPAAVQSFVEEFDGDVYVTSERDLPPGLADHRAPVPAHAMHQLLAFADVYFGDSGTMATEAGVLGTPAVRHDAHDAGMGNFAELEDYGLVTSVGEERAAVERALALAADPQAAERWSRRRRRMLADKIDVTAYMTTFVAEVARE